MQIYLFVFCDIYIFVYTDLLYRITLQFMFCCLTTKTSKAIDTIRMVVSGCILALLDVTVRKDAFDDPSTLTLAFNAIKNRWTFSNWGKLCCDCLDRLQISIPELARTKSRLQDYFYAIEKDDSSKSAHELYPFGKGVEKFQNFIGIVLRYKNRQQLADETMQAENFVSSSGAVPNDLLWELPEIRKMRDVIMMCRICMNIEYHQHDTPTSRADCVVVTPGNSINLCVQCMIKTYISYFVSSNFSILFCIIKLNLYSRFKMVPN